MSVPSQSHLPTDESIASPTATALRRESGPAKFRLRNVLMIVVPVAVLAAMVVAVSGFVDDALLGDLTRPALVPAKGQVTYQGQPLLNAQIGTQPTGRGMSALGWTDDEGKFTLKTDIRGKYVDGATVGEHRVTVMAYGTSGGPSAPPLLTPEQYASAGTSPLRITVKRNPDENEFKFVLEGDAPSRPTRPAKNKQGAPKKHGTPSLPTEGKQDAPDLP